jgi:site-specific recombinase XerD
MGDLVRGRAGGGPRGEGIWPRRDAGPLAAVMAELIAWLGGQGYAPLTQRNHVRAAARLGSWMAAAGLGLEDMDVGMAFELVGRDNEREPRHKSANENVAAVVRFLAETGRLGPSRVVGPAPRPAQVVLADWLRFLEAERHQGPSWVGKARVFGGRFLAEFEDGQGRLCWERVDAAMANAFLARQIRGYSSSTAQSMAALLRGLLSWAALNGWIGGRVRDGVLSPRRVRGGLPRAMSAGQVAALKNAVDPDSPTGPRDMAIIVMLARLGVRVGEVAGLSLDDIDWRAPSLRFVGKGQRVLVLPMPVDVGQALVGYLRVRRASGGERGVFVRSLAPLTRLGRAGVGEVVFKHARLAGLDGVTPHRLRHTAACQVLAGGGTLRQVQELLGHRDPASPLAYARVDMAPLRPMAPAWGRLP